MMLKLKAFFKKLFSRQVEEKKLVDLLVASVCSLELESEERAYLAPIKNKIWGNVEIRGTAIPIFWFTTWSDQYSQFLQNKVCLSVGNPIHYESFFPEGIPLNEETPKEVKEIFLELAHHLYNYFPIARKVKPHNYL
jgi:hypothetical protein